MLALAKMYASSPRPMHARVLCPRQNHSLVSVDRHVLLIFFCKPGIEPNTGRGTPRGDVVRLLVDKPDADLELSLQTVIKAALSPRYPILGHDVTILT